MSNIDANEVEKIDAYFDIIDKRIIVPIKERGIEKSCTATLVLLFAAIDGLGKLTCQDEDYKTPNKRFKSFLKRIGKEYDKKSDVLIGLGPSAISDSSKSFIQNIKELKKW